MSTHLSIPSLIVGDPDRIASIRVWCHACGWQSFHEFIIDDEVMPPIETLAQAAFAEHVCGNA